MPTTHLCLVSAQPTPNLTPALDPEVRPARIILLVSPDMGQRADWLEEVLRRWVAQIERWPIEDPWDVEHVQQRMLDLLERESKAGRGDELILNATGGTKPMSIAAYEAFRAYERPIFYVHPERDRLVWLHPSGRAARELADRVKLEDFLGSHGVKVKALHRSIRQASRSELGERLVAGLDRYGAALSTLNHYAQSAEGRLISDSLASVPKVLAELIALFRDAGEVTLREGRLRFPSEEARFFVNGGWLELYAFRQVQLLRQAGALIQDAAWGVEVARQASQGPVDNEIDVAFLASNRLYLLECKTRTWKGLGDGGGGGADALYKVDSLRDLMGGLQARAMLVSYQPPGAAVQGRAESLGVRICAGAELQRLREQVAKWIA
jgi:hypothetical protein